MSEENKKADWAEAVADRIVEGVNELKVNVNGPFKPLSKVLAYIPLIILTLVSAITLLTIGIFRLVDVYLPQSTWLAHFILGAIYLSSGLFLWSKRPQAHS